MKLPLSISEVQKNLKNKSCSYVEIVKTFLKRIEKYDKIYNSIITVCSESALKKAHEYDLLCQKSSSDIFYKKPLLGCTVIHKDLFLTKGIKTTAGSGILKDYYPDYSSTVTKIIENKGAITIGKANCDAWAHGASGENSEFGITKNPWNIDYVPGGSSSGSAAGVSAGFSLFSTGTDTGGSVRQPASFCNLVGFKPTYGAISRYGVIAMASSLDTIGLLTRTVKDSQKIFNEIKGKDYKDSTIVLKDGDKVKNKYRIGIPKEYFIEGLDNQVRNIVNKAADFYEKNGYDLVEVSLPHTKYAISAYYVIMSAEVSSNLARYDGIRYGQGRKQFGKEAKRRIILGTFVLSHGYYDAYYLKAMKVRTKISEDFNKAFDKVDMILSPVSPTPPFKIGEKTSDPLSMYLSDVYTASANLAGIPAISIPAGFTDDNLPVGFQLMGKRFSENILFDAGNVFQKENKYHEISPVL